MGLEGFAEASASCGKVYKLGSGEWSEDQFLVRHLDTLRTFN